MIKELKTYGAEGEGKILLDRTCNEKVYITESDFRDFLMSVLDDLTPKPQVA